MFDKDTLDDEPETETITLQNETLTPEDEASGIGIYTCPHTINYRIRQ